MFGIKNGYSKKVAFNILTQSEILKPETWQCIDELSYYRNEKQRFYRMKTNAPAVHTIQKEYPINEPNKTIESYFDKSPTGE